MSVELASTWEERIGRAIESFQADRLPVVVELSGVPKVGKTVFAGALTDLFAKAGCSVGASPDAAVEFPIPDRWGLDFSAWTIAAFIKRFLEFKACGEQVVVADRGLFDAMAWLRVKAELDVCDQETVNTFRALAYAEPWWSHHCVVLVFCAPTDEILRRARDRRLYSADSAVTTAPNLRRLRRALRREAEICNRHRAVVEMFDVGGKGLKQVLRAGADTVVSAVEAQASTRPV